MYCIKAYLNVREHGASVGNVLNLQSYGKKAPFYLAMC